MKISTFLKIGIVFFASLLFTNCKNCKPSGSNEAQKWVKVKSPKGGKFNLFIEKVETDISNPRSETKFQVLDKKSCEKVYEGQVKAGYVKWYDKTKIELFSAPGMMSEEMSKEDFITIYDLVNKTSKSKKELEK